MKIGTWNTGSRLSPSISTNPNSRIDRASFLRSLDYDLWALQECEERPAVAEFTEAVHGQAANRQDGYVVIASKYKLFDKVVPPVGSSLACIVDAPKPFVFANVWAYEKPLIRPCSYFGYVERAKLMLDFFIEYASDLRLPLIVAGDFNLSPGHKKSSKYTDKLRRETLNSWHESGLRSAYHEYSGEVMGEETHPTVEGYSHGGWHYHIDYIFYDRDAFVPKVVKTFDQMKSDHWPMTATFEHLPMCEAEI